MLVLPFPASVERQEKNRFSFYLFIREWVCCPELILYYICALNLSLIVEWLFLNPHSNETVREGIEENWTRGAFPWEPGNHNRKTAICFVCKQNQPTKYDERLGWSDILRPGHVNGLGSRGCAARLVRPFHRSISESDTAGTSGARCTQPSGQPETYKDDLCPWRATRTPKYCHDWQDAEECN